MRILAKLISILALIGAIYAIGTLGMREFEKFDGGNDVRIRM